MLHEHQLHNYQLGAVDHIMENPYAGLFMKMGLGKTVSTLTAINRLIYEELAVTKALVIGPKRVVESVWHREVNNWSHLNHLKVSRVIGSQKQRMRALEEEADIYLVSRDNIAWLCGLYGGSMLPFDMLVIDESSSFKNHKSVRFKALRKCLHSFKYRVILTGTPSPNGLLDLWSQIYLLDQGERLGKFITKYRQTYFNAGRTNGHIVYNYNIKDRAEKAIYRKIQDICMSMDSKDYLKLPGRKDNFINIDFPDKLQKQYNEFEKEAVLEFIESQSDLNHISVANAAALSNKLLQYANGAVYDEDKKVHEVHDLKLKATEQIIEEAQGRPVLIAYTYRSDLDRLMKHLKKYKPVKLKTDQHIDDWNEGKIRVLIMHPASGGHGLNLQAGGSDIVWFGQTWSLELYEQFNARLDRQGQKQITVVNHLISNKTIDQRVILAIQGKQDVQEGLMGAIKAKIKQYLKK